MHLDEHDGVRDGEIVLGILIVNRLEGAPS
jgi:hypothetical protein